MTEPRLGPVLLTNDDGIDAPGLATLEAVANDLGVEVWVVAPDHDQSGVSHALSLHQPLRVTNRGSRRFSVSGTPGDCVAMAICELMPARPQLVLSGINKGANLGRETAFSGTVGAAMAALLMGLPAIALSQAFTRRDAVRWETARQLAPGVIRQLWAARWSPDACLNVNFPDVPADQAGPLQVTCQGRGRMHGLQVTGRTDLREQAYYWLNIKRDDTPDAPDSETAVLAGGGIAVTPLHFERTAHEARVALVEWLRKGEPGKILGAAEHIWKRQRGLARRVFQGGTSVKSMYWSDLFTPSRAGVRLNSEGRVRVTARPGISTTAPGQSGPHRVQSTHVPKET
ncbi:5'/3'-nucleotidase SurE [Pseudomonas massiliensis]|uniref:5'/3'-nucleotidase SurE n=1 Tax=Pseudomonas massiliensis TaxID=522492 RepID=UPI000A019A13|nr:5'/3'-nucleotidase SurE [Pseudomonas massiliensis]